MQSLLTLISPGVIGQHENVERRICWLAHVVSWQPANEQDGEEGEEEEGGEEEDNVLLSSVSTTSCRDPSVSVLDVLTMEATNAEGGTRMVLLRQMTIGPWRGVHQFIETEVDVSKQIGESLEAWYTVSLLGATLMSIKRSAKSKHARREKY